MSEKELLRLKRRSNWSEGWVGVGTGLVLIAAALLSMGGSSATGRSGKTSSVIAESSAGSTMPVGIANADRDTLDLQLD